MEGFVDRLADVYTRTHLKNPYRTYRLLRRFAPVWRLPPVAQLFFEQYEWVLTRYEDCALALRDPRLRAHEPGEMCQRFGPASAEPCVQDFAKIIALQNPPHHTRLRGLLLRAFTSRRMEELRHFVQEKADQLLDRVSAAGRMDAIADLAFPVATFAICRLIGIPEEDLPRFAGGTMNNLLLFEPAPLTRKKLAHANEAFETSGGYFEALLETRRQLPQDDLITQLVQAEGAGLVSRADLLANIRFLFVAGHETVVGLIGNGLLALLGHREQWQALRADPALVAGAVEEMLRYEPPVQAVQRVVSEKVELNGTTLRPRETVAILIAAASRDPSVFERPDRFDILRGNVRSLCFGGGIHFCIGAQLARLEATVVLETLLRRLPSLHVAQSYRPDWRPSVFLRGLGSLPLVWR
ncbi:MAG: cytochrome P450 [Acetobacteraceae bacterium]|nr:cytochrome P450 [Acetobacteraceae bacterium]